MPKLTSTPSVKAMNDALDTERQRVQDLMYNDKLGDQEKLMLTKRIVEDIKADEASRKEFMDIRTEILELYEGKKKPKSDPFEGCANIQTMLTAMVAELLHSKLFPVAYNEDLTYWVPVEATDVTQADGVSKFMKWDVRSNKLVDFVDDYTHTMILEGTTVSKTYWDSEFRWVQRRILRASSILKRVKAKFYTLIGREAEIELDAGDYDIKYEYKKFEFVRTELLPLEDVGFPCWSVPGSDEDRLAHIWHRTRPYLRSLKTKARLGYYENVDKVAGAVESRMINEGQLQAARTEAEGTQYIVNKEVKLEGYPLDVVEWYGSVDIPGEGPMEMIVWIEAKTETFLGMMPLVKVSRLCKRPFVIGQFIRRAHRLYGKTVLDMIKELNKEADTIHDQRLDIGTMAIIPPGVYRSASGTEADQIKLKPGVMVPVDDVNDVKWLQVPNNVLVSFQEERMLMELVEKISSVGSYQSGQESDINRSRSTARGTLAIIAQSDQRFQVLGKRIQGPLARILLKRLELYQQNIPPGLENRVLGEDGKKIFPIGISVEDLAGNFDVVQGLDTTGGSKVVKREQDVQLFQLMMASPLVQQNPSGMWELHSNVLADYGIVEPERIIGPRPVQAQQQIKDQADVIRAEITQIREGNMPKTEMGSDPMSILQALMAYKATAEGKLLEPEKMGLLDARIATLKLELVNKAAEAQTMGQVAGGMQDARLGQGAGMGLPPAPNMAQVPGAAQAPVPGQVEEVPGAAQTGPGTPVGV